MKILASIVTYFPDKKVINFILKNLQYFSKLLIIDNTGNNQKPDLLNSLINEYPQIELISNSENMGIAVALNQALDYAKKHDYDWLVTLDQDSYFPSNPTKILNQIVTGSKFNPEKTVLVSSIFQDRHTGEITFQSKQSRQDLDSIAITFTSGNFLNIQLLKKHHDLQFTDKLFIYHVDNDFCLQIKKYGLEILESKSIVLSHSEGSQSKHRFLWKKNLLVTNHSFLARYYISRNHIFVLKKYLFIYPKICFQLTYHYLKSVAKMVLLEDKKFTKLKFVLLGFYHGIIGRWGKL